MKMVATIVTIIGVLSFVLTIIAKLGSKMIMGMGPRALGAGTALFFLLAIVLLLSKEN